MFVYMRTSTSIVEHQGVSQPAVGSPELHAAGSGGLGWSIVAAGTVTAVLVLSNSATPLYAHWQAEWGFGSGMLTVIFGIYIVGLIAALVVGGRMADRFGRKAVLVPGLASAVLASLLFVGAQNVMWILAARLLAGIAVGAAVTAGMAATVDLAPEHRKRTGSLIASISMVFGAGLGPLLAGGVASSGSGSPQYLVFGIVLAIELVALIVVFLLPLKRPARAGAGLRLSWPSVPSENRREVRWGIGAFAPGITATSFVLALGPTVLHRVGVSNPFVAGAVACAMFLVASAVQFVLARVTTRAHLLLSSITTIAAMVVLVLAVTGVQAVALVVIAALLAGAAQGLGQLAGLSLIATHVPSDKRAESNAVLTIGGYVPAGILSVLVGYASDAVGLSLAVSIFGAVLIAAALTALATTGRSAGHRRTEGE